MPVATKTTRLKFCGITRPVDAEAACQLGVHMLGLIFVPATPRALSRDQAHTIRQTIGNKAYICGVFADQEVATINAYAREFALYVQLHGRESTGYCRQIERPVIKTLDLTAANLDDQIASYRHVAAYILLDLPKSGGKRQLVAADLEKINKLKSPPPFIVAGGLDATTARSTIEWCRPFALDVCSGIEQAPGLKDVTRMRHLCALVQGEKS